MSEPASIPMWQTVVGLLGLGSLIATGLQAINDALAELNVLPGEIETRQGTSAA